MEFAFFLVFGIAAVVTAAFVVIARNPINSAIALIGTFLSLAGIYVLLNAHFMAVVQVLVYAGAIMVLFIFVIMLLNMREDELGERRVGFIKILGVVLGLALFGILASVLVDQTVVAETVSNQDIAAGWGGIRDVGELLFTKYLLPFEVVSILLLVAIVGAMMIAKRRT